MKRGWLIAAGYESAGLNGCADCGQNNQARRTGFGCRMSRAVVGFDRFFDLCQH